jgi:hypothetical protein
MSGIVRANNSGQSGAVSNIETIDSDDYVDASIDNAHLADDAVDSDELAAGSVDNAHLADDAVDSDELAAGAVDTAHIGANQVTAAKIFDLARGSVLVGNASAATAELTIGSNTYVLASDGTDIAWTAASAGAVTRVGGNDSENTTNATSGSPAELLASASMTIGAEVPILMMANARKYGDDTQGGEVGFTMTVSGGSVVNVRLPVAATANLWSSGGQNEAQDGGFVFFILPRSTNYQQGLLGMMAAHSGASIRGSRAGGAVALGASMPIGTVTDIDLHGANSSGSTIYTGVDHFHLHTLAIS